MKYNSSLDKAIKEKNIIGIRSAMYTMAHENPSFESGHFIQVFNELKTMEIKGLFDEHEGELLENDSNWNEAYWAKVASKMMDNFSVDRVEHLIKVGKKVYKKDYSSQKNYNTNTNKQRNASKSLGDDSLLKLVGTLISAVALISVIFKKGKR